MSMRKYLPNSAVIALALLSSAVGVVNDYTYDDRYVVLLNPLTHSLHRWWAVFAQPYWPRAWTGDGYRPLTILAFSVEWVARHGSPIAFHAANILLYVLASVLVYQLALVLLPAWAAWVVGALFAVHPVHVEAVANVVGQSELLVAVAILAATILYIRDRRAGALRPGTAVAVTVLYAIAAFSKEHGIVLPAILIAAEYTVIDDATPLRDRARRLRPFYLALLAVAVGFVAARSRVLSDHTIGGFQPFMPFAMLKISARDRILSAITVVPQWVRLLLWPARLSADYGPPGLEIAQGYSITQLPGLLLLVAVVALGVLLRHRQRVLSFGIAIVCIALLPSSNLILPAGIMLAERTLFLPSVGAVLVVGALVVVLADLARARWGESRAVRVAAVSACVALLATGAYRSATRTTVWKNNDVVFHHAVLDAPYDYRAHYMLGAVEFEAGNRRAGEAEYRKALRLFPYDPGMSFGLAEQYRVVGMCEPALPLYKWTLGLDPGFPVGRTQYATCLLKEHDFTEAKHWAIEAVKVGGNLASLHHLIVAIDSVKKADQAQGVPGGRGISKAPSKVPDSMQKAAP